MRELEGKLTAIKSTELKRLNELNAQAVALEQEREKQRLFREEQGLKAQGELKKAEIDRLQKERKLQARTVSLINEQEKQRKLEADALANEQDRIRHAQLENEQHWADLARKSQLAQQNWLVIDDSLSLKQAQEEVKMIKQELVSLKKRMEYQYDDNVKTLKKAYALQIELTKPKLPPQLLEKDAFETTVEYAKRKTIFDSDVKVAESANAAVIEKLQNELNLKIIQSKVDYIEQKIKVSAPFIVRLKALQARQFILPGEQIAIELGAPNADRSCFPSTLKYKEKTWSVDWKYTDRNKARDIYSTRMYLKAEALVQLDETKKEGYMMTAARITHPGTGEQSVLSVAEVESFTEIKELNENSSKVLAEYKEKLTAATNVIEHRRQYLSSTSQYELSIDGATVYDTETGLIWAQNANSAGKKMNRSAALSWVRGINIGGFKDWRLPSKEELESLAKAGGARPEELFKEIGFSNVQQAAFYWSSTSHIDADNNAWFVYMYGGSAGYCDKANKGYVWPVRAGQ